MVLSYLQLEVELTSLCESLVRCPAAIRVQ